MPGRTDPEMRADTDLQGAKEHKHKADKQFRSEHALQRHFREVHKKKREGAVTTGKYLTGVCVDFRKGIFMVRRSFSGVSRPIHCQHSTYAEPSTAGVTACELNECRGAAVVARLSGHPAFECVHLQSLQYALPYQQPVTLTETSLDDLTGKKLAWFKESRKKDRLSLKERADQGGHPLVFRFPREQNNTTSQRFWYFSIFDGGVHYWSRFGRVIACYDSQHNQWMCVCSSSKCHCVHKSLAKWFVYQVEPSLLSDIDVHEDLVDGFPSDENSDEDLEGDYANFATASHYPPTGTILEEMIWYQRASKRLPSLIPPGILAIDVPLSNHFIPSEEVCHVCHSSLSDPQEISNKGMIIGLTKVSSGTLIFSFFNSAVRIGNRKLSQLLPYLLYICHNVDTNSIIFTILRHNVFCNYLHCKCDMFSDISTYYKECVNCGMMYRYQDYRDNIHNFDDIHLFSLTVLQLLRALVKVCLLTCLIAAFRQD